MVPVQHIVATYQPASMTIPECLHTHNGQRRTLCIKPFKKNLAGVRRVSKDWGAITTANGFCSHGPSFFTPKPSQEACSREAFPSPQARNGIRHRQPLGRLPRFQDRLNKHHEEKFPWKQPPICWQMCDCVGKPIVNRPVLGWFIYHLFYLDGDFWGWCMGLGFTT